MKKLASTQAAAQTVNQPSAPVPPTAFPAKPKPQTAKEIITANVQLLIEQLESGHSEGLTAYLTAMGMSAGAKLGHSGPRERCALAE